jgi:hypothetical protein
VGKQEHKHVSDCCVDATINDAFAAGTIIFQASTRPIDNCYSEFKSDDDQKVLGINIDQNLKWKLHTEKLTKKLNSLRFCFLNSFKFNIN